MIIEMDKNTEEEIKKQNSSGIMAAVTEHMFSDVIISGIYNN